MGTKAYFIFMKLAAFKIATIGVRYVGMPLIVEFGKNCCFRIYYLSEHKDELKSCQDHILKVSLSPDELKLTS